MPITVGTSSITFNDGSVQTSAASSYRGSSVEVFTSSGTWTCPAGVTRVKATLIGGGGGSGGGSSFSFYSAGGGGGGGAVCVGVVSVTPGQNYSYTIGSGGSPGAAPINYNTTYTAGSGTATTFNGLTAGGGAGGSGGNGPGSNNSAAGAGGTSSGTGMISALSHPGQNGQAGNGGENADSPGAGGRPGGGDFFSTFYGYNDGIPSFDTFAGIRVAGGQASSSNSGGGTGYRSDAPYGAGAGGVGARSSGTKPAGASGGPGILVLEY